MANNTTHAQQIEAARTRALTVALNNLLAFLDPGNPDCGVDPEVRKAAGAYLDSWVAGPMEAALNGHDLAEYRNEPTMLADEFLAKFKR